MSYPDDDDDQIPETGAVFTFGRSRFADNIANKFWIKNDPIVNIACGDEHSAVVTESGRLYVFGSNDWGQLGLGHTKSLNKPSFVKALKPEKIKQAACGRNHTIVYSESGKIFSFGCNEDGQLGHAEKNNELLPKEIEYLSLMKMKQIACGTYHSVALSEDGDVYVWGNNNEGQLGVGEGVEKILPKKLKFKKEVVSVSCGYYHTALVTRDGFLYTFGEDELGKLGLSGPQLNDTTLPQPVAAPSDNDGYISVSCGARHTVAVTKQGHCYAWGDGSQGQLGHGTKLLEVNEPKQIDKLSGHKCISVSCGESHTAVITASGKIFTFGDGRHGKLGQGEESFSNIFNPVYLSRFNFFNVISVSCGGCHMLVQAVHRNKDDIIDGEDSLMASITSQKSLKEANMTLRPGNTTFPSTSPRDKRRLKDGNGNSGIDKSLNKSVSLNSSMTMAQLNRTMPELPSRLDKSKLPKIPGLNLSDNDCNGSNNHLYNGKSRQAEDHSSLSSVENENKKNKRLVSEVSFSRTAKVKNNPEDHLLNNHKKKESVANKNFDIDEDDDDLLKRQQVHILSSKSINSNESNKSLNKVKNNKSKHNQNSEEEEENKHTDFSENKLKNLNDKLKKQNKVDSEEDEENISTDKEVSQKHSKIKNRDKKKVSLEDENSEEEIKYKTKQAKLNKPDNSRNEKHKKRFIEDDNDDDEEEEEESEEDNGDVEEDENNEDSEASEEESNHKSSSKVTTNKSKSIMQSKPKSIEKIKSKSVSIEKLKSKPNEKNTKNEKNKLENNKNKKRTNHKSKEPSEDEEEDDEEEENDNEEEHSEDEDAEEEEEDGNNNNDDDDNEDDDDGEEEEENEEDDNENNENNSGKKKGVKLKNNKDLDKNKDKKTRFLNFFRRKKQQTPPDAQSDDDNETGDNQKSKACIIL